jgi:hypothetical protein
MLVPAFNTQVVRKAMIHTQAVLLTHSWRLILWVRRMGEAQMEPTFTKLCFDFGAPDLLFVLLTVGGRCCW